MQRKRHTQGQKHRMVHCIIPIPENKAAHRDAHHKQQSGQMQPTEQPLSGSRCGTAGRRGGLLHVCACMRPCMCACMQASLRASVRACVQAGGRPCRAGRSHRHAGLGRWVHGACSAMHLLKENALKVTRWRDQWRWQHHPPSLYVLSLLYLSTRMCICAPHAHVEDVEHLPKAD